MGTATVTLNGRTYRLGCGDGEEARLKELSDYVAAKVDGLSAAVGQVGNDRLLVMAALIIADELFETRERIAEGHEAAARRGARRARTQIGKPPAGPGDQDQAHAPAALPPPAPGAAPGLDI